MPLLKLKFDPKVGAIIPVVLEYKDEGEKKSHKTRALIDTGASSTCVSGRLIKTLGLSPDEETVPITGTTGKMESRTFSVDIVLAIDIEEFSFGCQLVEYNETSPTYDILLGRDILQHFLLQTHGSDGLIGY
ncbi:MAG: retroviral-like aspartic protease [Alphaproteobacteria bacterium GM202ARS2]|nr:retroviral-like aspartic protease [Alphaproteobacteria bacterium GM202ARS2]